MGVVGGHIVRAIGRGGTDEEIRAPGGWWCLAVRILSPGDYWASNLQRPRMEEGFAGKLAKDEAPVLGGSGIPEEQVIVVSIDGRARVDEDTRCGTEDPPHSRELSRGQ